jgi:uncharacterized protein (TIGR00369 family)
MPFDPDRYPALAKMQAVSLFSSLRYQFTDAGDGWAEIGFTASERTYNLYGIVHGGAWLFLADSAMGGALGTVCAATEQIIATQLDFRWLGSLRGTKIRARGRVLRRGRTVSHAAVELFDAEDRLIGTGNGTYVIVPAADQP